MKILLLGSTGQLGWELNRSLLTLSKLIALDYPQIDMSNPDNIRSQVRTHQPDMIINATAYTNVDKAESEPELAMAINGTGPGVLAEEAKSLGGALIHYSTDYVFDGNKGEPYLETDTPAPINVYGETKLAGEQAVQSVGGTYMIFRTSWVYSMRRPSFVNKVLKWARQKEKLLIVDDQISSPSWARMLAEATASIIAKNRNETGVSLRSKSGLYHLTGNGSCSRLDWAKAILALDPKKEEQIYKTLLPGKSNDFSNPAKRPKISVLSCDKFQTTFKLILPDWRDTLALAMAN